MLVLAVAASRSWLVAARKRRDEFGAFSHEDKDRLAHAVIRGLLLAVGVDLMCRSNA